jgi:DNA-directed RNA polymerase specialized sigma24 family protein
VRICCQTPAAMHTIAYLVSFATWRAVASCSIPKAISNLVPWLEACLHRARIDAIKARKGADPEAEMDESTATKQGRKLSTMRVDPKARDLPHPNVHD